MAGGVGAIIQGTAIIRGNTVPLFTVVPGQKQLRSYVCGFRVPLGCLYQLADPYGKKSGGEKRPSCRLFI